MVFCLNRKSPIANYNKRLSSFVGANHILLYASMLIYTKHYPNYRYRVLRTIFCLSPRIKILNKVEVFMIIKKVGKGLRQRDVDLI